MSKKLYEEDNIQEIASAIREKNEEGSGTPSSETYRVMDMAPAIRALPVINPSDYRKAADQDIIDNAQNTEINTTKTNLSNNYRKAADQDVIDNAQNDNISQLQEMSSFFKPIPGTTETVSFDQNGRPESITHTNDIETVRTDTFEWGDNTVTETRTLANGRHIIMTTDLSTLITTISEIQEGT